jgi:hypothetical protein
MHEYVWLYWFWVFFYVYVIHRVVIKIRQLFLRPATSMTSTLLKSGVGANDCKCSWDQQLNVLSEARRSSK